ncbi:ornithine racemase Orr [Haloplasma contractile]|uniref:Alanine racemase protein n=1 Tax=Haloplasma contractile SSD-17B TaxID=1033810 RepID=U2E8Y8_9MOLU|nr:ornithine racemase Orr [Haloplasma contractile]ERJ11608.1 Putative alanine racemase protein [Haloplasma contractile SSD-17B]
MYPHIRIDLNKLAFNTKILTNRCKQKGINTIFGVTKVLAGDMESVDTMVNSGITHIADSRIENLAKFKDYSMPKVLLRLPMQNEADEVVKYANLSLNSELSTINCLNTSAKRQNSVHEVILMIDLGDLREGIWFKDFNMDTIEQIINLNHIKLKGIGTNLTCYGGIIPTTETLEQLVEFKHKIEDTFNITLDIISGGNTSSLHLVLIDKMPCGINNLRLGEGIVLGRETAYLEDLADLHQDVFELKAQIIELKEKPSVPIGEIGVDAFGKKPIFTDKGTIKRAIVALGKQDVDPDHIKPQNESIEILGSSSDHLILDVTRTDLNLGGIVTFNVDYGGLLQVMTSPYVKKVHV